MNHIIFFLALLWLSFVMAKLEINIEGQYGWAEKLPTKRLSSNHWISKLVFGGRPATGYHLWLSILIFSLLHTVYLFYPFTWQIELKIVSFFILFWMIEDFLWFVLNSAYGLKNFKPEKIWWHRNNWWGIAPREYFILIPIGITLYIISIII